MKAARRGVRMRDLLRPERLRAQVASNLDDLAAMIEHLGGTVPGTVEVTRWIDEALAAGEKLRAYTGDAGRHVSNVIKEGRHVLFEGAQGCLLDLDHGTYPYVTSSSTIAAGACQSAGIGPTQIDHVVGITKAYATRVGEGPFPTELHGDEGERLRKAGGEYGATTGRPRRCGWLDLPALRMGVRLSGMQSLALTKLDGKELDEPPTDPEDLSRAEPIYKQMPGWDTLPSSPRAIEDLPATARNYVQTISQMAGVPFCLVSVGPDRSETIRLTDPFAS
jgi:adenylosuccinate synthase